MKNRIFLALGALLLWCALFSVYGFGAEPAPINVQKRGDGSSVMLGAGVQAPLLVIGTAPTGAGVLRIASGGTLDIQAGAIVNFPTGFIPWAAVNKTGSSLLDLTTRSAADLSTGTLLVARLPAFSGDASTSAGSSVLTLATVASGATTGSSTAIPVITFNNKGLVTAVTTAAVIAPAGTLTGTTLAANVVTSSLTSVGTLTGGATGAGFTVNLGTSTISGLLLGVNGGTGVNNSGKTITLGGNWTSGGAVTWSGGFAFTGTLTNTTSVTFPVSGTLATTAGTVASVQGTAGQILANGLSTPAQTGAVVLTLPTAITGVNSVTSVALSNLVLGTGTFGTSATFASATGALTLASTTASTTTGTGALVVGGGVGVAGRGTFGSLSAPGSGSQTERFGNAAATNDATRSLAVGDSASVATGGSYGVALGYGAATSSDAAIAIGGNASATNGRNVAIGYNSSANTNYGVAVGYGAVSAGGTGVRVGANGSAANNSIAIGYGITATTGQIILGYGNSDAEVWLGAGPAAGAAYYSRINGVGGASTGINGGILYLSGGKGGVAADTGGSVRIQTAASGAGQTLVDRLIVAANGDISHTSTTASTSTSTGGATFAGGVGIAGNLVLTGADWNNTLAGRFTVTTNAAATGFAHQVASGNTSGVTLGQTGVRNWNIENIATTGIFSILDSSTTRMTIDASGNAVFGAANAGSYQVSSRNSGGALRNGFDVINDFISGSAVTGHYLYGSSYASNNVFGEAIAAYETDIWASHTSGAMKVGTVSTVPLSFYVNSVRRGGWSGAGAFDMVSNSTFAGTVLISGSGAASVLDVIGLVSGGSNFRVSSNATDVTNKSAKFGIRPYTIAQNDALILEADTTTSSNALAIGGSTSTHQAMTDISFYTAAAINTATGTRRGGFSSAGVFDITATTVASSTTTGALVVGGGLGVAGKAYIGGNVQIWNGTGTGFSFDSNTGAIQLVSGLASDFIVLNAKGTGTVDLNHGGGSGGTRFLDGGSTVVASISGAGVLNINSTTDASSVSTGSIITTGGLGVAKSIYSGGTTINLTSTANALLHLQRNATSPSTLDISATSDFVDFTYTVGGSAGIRWFNVATERMRLTDAGVLSLTNTTDSTTTGNGSFFTAGGVGIAKAMSLGGKVTTYNGLATAGNGVASIQAAGRVTAQTAANASVATYTVGASDASFIISSNVLVTASTTHNFTVTCAYTDEGNTARTATFNFANVAGTIATAIANAGGAVPYQGVPLHIRAKAATTITVATAGTFTSVTYNAEGVITKLQ